MPTLQSSTNQPAAMRDHLPLLAYPEFSLGLQCHIRSLRLLAYGLVALGISLIATALVACNLS